MGLRFTWESPSCRLVLCAVLSALAELGHAGLTLEEIQARAGAAGQGLEQSDLDEVVVVALQHVRLFPVPEATGSLRGDLLRLLETWLGNRGPDERVIAAVLSAAEWNPGLRVAVIEAFDRPLAQAVGALLARATGDGAAQPERIQTLNWILRGLALNRLRAVDARTLVDLHQLVDHLLDGLAPGGGGSPCRT
ncbi:hypothetical protein E4P40_07715 [Blastococcus sp. CT_GayMR20]|nr:hypothetical protein E4P40_07715 [Blastococcus sp. CT_GayMR20]